MAMGFAGSGGGVKKLRMPVRLEDLSGKLEENMAVGFAGSGGGVKKLRATTSQKDICDEWYRQFSPDVSLFVNRRCNLACRHCYVTYEESENALSLPEWFALIGDFLRLRARRFGIVGMEPTLVWEKTLGILAFLADKRAHGYPVVYGIVTNGIGLNEKKCRDLIDAGVDYLDISLDGTQEVHDKIRGKGAYGQTIGRIVRMPDSLRKKLFVSFTCNAENRDVFPALVDALYAEGVKQFVFSPYAAVGDKKGDPLYLPDEGIVDVVEGLVSGKFFHGKKDVLVYVKSDRLVSGGVFDELLKRNIIRSDKLFVDEHGMIFDEKTYPDNNRIVVNYQPEHVPLLHSVRVFDDGRVGRCTDMFFAESPGVVGNVRDTPIKKLLGL